MDTDNRGPDLQGGKNAAFLLKEETHAIIGCAFEVLNGLGHGLSEKCYENALVVEFIQNFKHPRLEWERIAL
jgi:uncharacterized protein YkvS